MNRSTQQHESDTADEYLLAEFGRLEHRSSERTLVLNDKAGVLAVAIAPMSDVVSSGDSWIAAEALRTRVQTTGSAPVPFVRSGQPFDGRFTTVVARVPKNLALFEDQLARVAGCLEPGAVVVAGGMDKHLPRGANDLLDRYVGDVHVSLGWKKARLLVAAAQARTRRNAPVPAVYAVPELGISLENDANVFSRLRLDAGTRMLLGPLQQSPAQRVTDVGCGNGVLGIALALALPAAQVRFVDESFMAVASTTRNWKSVFADRPVEVVANDGLAGIAEGSSDLVVSNPPFHSGHRIGDDTAWSFFSEARRVLTPDGSLLIVGNRHLGYHARLRRLFPHVEQLAASPTYVVLRAGRQVAR